MKRKLLTGLFLAPLLVAAACSNPVSDPEPVTPATTTVAVQPSPSQPVVVMPPDASDPTVEPVTTTPTVTVPKPYGPTLPNPCRDAYSGWSTKKDSTKIKLVEGTIDMVRIGQHECFDRIVVDVDTKEKVGFHAEYVPVVEHLGNGFPVEVAGEAVLQVVIDAQVPMTPNGMPAFTTTPNWDVLREIRSAGSFEGITKLAIGVSSKVKFGVYHHTSEDGKTHVVIDLIHPF